MYIGIDLGTSGVKSIVMSSDGNIIATKTISLSISRPNDCYSEQDPHEWWEATCKSILLLSNEVDLSQLKSIGLSGQMHGATLLDKSGDIIRPAILWNDGRSEQECRELELSVPNSRDITGNIMMPGFTAPKIRWIAKNEPENFLKIDKVLLPKDYLRYKMTGDFASDLSDSAGTLWLNIHTRDWSDELLSATGLTRDNMPKLYDGNQITGYLSPEVASKWNVPIVPVIAGGGDNAAGAIGVGIINPGQGMLSLGTSGVYFSVSNGVITNTESALHSFCHALPNTWHTMSVILSAASCLKWVAELTQYDDVATMLEDVEQNANTSSGVIFLPYLSGERTPHNNPHAKGVFFGMTHLTTRRELALAVLEGVGFAFADGFEALHANEVPDDVSLIGGGARSEYWRQMLSNIIGVPLEYRKGGDVGPALGAARLAMLAVESNADLNKVCPVPKLIQRHVPNPTTRQHYQQKRELFKSLYKQLHSLF